MTLITLDTSALSAVLDADDRHHEQAIGVWKELLPDGAALLCTNYILVETFALAQHRLGMEAVRALQNVGLPVLTVEWVDADLHARSIAALRTANRRDLSLVDCCTFELMRMRGIETAFAFDRHFSEQGFGLLPSP